MPTDKDRLATLWQQIFAKLDEMIELARILQDLPTAEQPAPR